MHPLPICPRPYDQEAARSWLNRVGEVYGLNAERLVGVLGLVPFQSGSTSRLSRPVETVLDPPWLHAVAIAAQLPADRLANLRPGLADWTLTHRQECCACAPCLAQDLRSNRPPYLRAAWRQAWQIFCPIHGVRLVRCPMGLLSGHWTTARVCDAVTGLSAATQVIESQIQSLHLRDNYFRNLTQIFKEMELTIGRAISGEAPNPDDWGDLTASAFLQVVHDVTTWSLTNFESFKARPASEDPPSGTRLWQTPYFTMSHRYQPPFEDALTLRTLSSVNLPELRCPALWWAHALLCSTDRCCDRLTGNPPTRQAAFLRRCCPVGLHWLQQQMAYWPLAYVRRHWAALELPF